MTITLDNGKTFDAHWAWGPVASTGRLMIELAHETRPIARVAEDFDGVKRIERRDEDQGDMTFEGYTHLVSVSLDTNRETAQLALEKPQQRGDEP